MENFNGLGRPGEKAASHPFRALIKFPYIQVSDAVPLTFGDVFVTVVVTVMVKFEGAVAVTVTTPAFTHWAEPESLMPAMSPLLVAQVSPSACVSWRLEWSLKVPVAV